MKKLPFTINIIGAPITVRYWQEGDPPLEKNLAFFDESTGNVVIRPGEEGTSLHILVMHEFLHIIEVSLIQRGFLTEEVSHDFIQYAASGLVLLLADAGIIDLPMEDVLKFYETESDKLGTEQAEERR